MKNTVHKTGIYIHIPFCKRTCYYCNFTKFKFKKEHEQKYVSALIKEISERNEKNQVADTVYFGGGSPALFSERSLGKIFEILDKKFIIDKNSEVTIELNPEEGNLDKLRSLARSGFNRVSIGTQSFSEKDLQYLKRNHSAADSLAAVENGLKAGFNNISMDYIIGLPTQDKMSIRNNFKILKEMDIPHISAYMLEGVKNFRNIEQPEDGHQVYLYNLTRDILLNNGYEHYEVSNFCKNGEYSKHNLKYWNNISYAGFGVGASGFENGIDYRNYSSLSDYFKHISDGRNPVMEKKRTDPETRRIITGMRLTRGIDVAAFNNYRSTLDTLLKEKILIRTGNKISVNPLKITLLNEILLYFID
ncbi:MAG: radical SAM family heme chaperone HemW [Acidobacteriota bacterium]